jgi:hypothetical protein
LTLVTTLVAVAIGCGGSNISDDLGAVVVLIDHGGSKDAPGRDSTPRDAQGGELADGTSGSDTISEINDDDTGQQGDEGGNDNGIQDQGITDSGTKDVFHPRDYGTEQDPGSSDDTGSLFDAGPDTGMVGGCDPCGMGTVAGKTCAPNVKTAIPYVLVWVDSIDCNGVPQHYQTYSSAKGEYSLEIPCGTQTINMRKGSFQGSYTRWIDKGMVTTMTSADGCFAGTAAKIAVITGDWDKIEATLKLLSLKYKLIIGTGGMSSQESDTAVQFLLDATNLMTYDILFLDCSEAARPNMLGTRRAEIKANLKAFVAKGGSIYASDYALPYLTETWPTFILGGAHSASGNSSYLTNVVDTDLAGFLGKTQVTIRYGLGPLTCISGVDPSTHVFIESTKTINTCDGRQMMVSFQPETNGGRVIYTTFHNEEQPVAGGDMQSILEYTVFLM